MSETWRLFVAIPIGDELRAALLDAVGGWRSRPDLAGLRWTDPDAWHLTIAFIGSVAPMAVDDLVAALRHVAAQHHPCALATGGLGAFPARARARVAWYGIADADGALGRLASDVAPAVRVEPAGRFRPHITLARANDPVDLRRWLSEAVAPTGRLAIDRLDLMRSHPGRGPASYEGLASVVIGEVGRA